MNATEVQLPGEDAWVLARLGRMVTARLINCCDAPDTRQGLMRLLFGLQRLPILTPGLCISLGSGSVYVAINSELFELTSYTDDGHTAFRLQYLSGSNHCIHWYDVLTEGEKRYAVEQRLDSLEASLSEGEPLLIEDHSLPGYIDEPPLNDYMEYSLSYEPL